MEPRQILLMRHGEKPNDPVDPNLSPAGRQRAQNLASYMPTTFGQPDFLFAAASTKHSLRPVQTLEPLSEMSRLEINSDFADEDYEALAREILTKSSYDGKTIVICWHHEYLPPFAHALKAKQGDYPNPWDPAVFDLLLQFSFSHGIPNVTRVTEPF
jgi:phosphohistidine phosphatase SixA